MQPPARPHDDAARLEALRNLNLMDTLPEQEYEDLAHLAAALLGTPMAAITLIDEERQWFKANVNIPVPGTSRDDSFCGHTILGQDLFVVQDAARDVRFHDNPLVVGDPSIRFYAGMPLATPDGQAVGALCVIDREPRQLSEEEGKTLRVLARQVATHFQLRLQLRDVQEANEKLTKVERRLRLSQERLRSANIKLREMAGTDALTGLHNRRAFDARLSYEWKLSARLGEPLSLLMLDLDHFKAVNDRYGHACGDEVLHHTASVLTQSLRETDFVGRYGGEEFSVMLPATGHDHALLVAEHLRSAIAAHPCATTGAGDLRVTASIGVASGTARPGDPGGHSLVAQADAALYAAKSAGRNRVASAQAARLLVAIGGQ